VELNPFGNLQFYQKIRLIGNENNITCNFTNLNYFLKIIVALCYSSFTKTNKLILFKQHCFIGVAA